MPEDATDKVDILEALKIGLLISSSMVFGLASLYLMAYLDLMGLGVLRNISFVFVLISMLVVFNISFSLSLIDQLRA